MIPVLMAVSPAVWITGVSALWWLAGLLLGLRVNAKRLASLREQLRLANQLHSAYITSAHNEDLAEVGPATGDHKRVELYDQDAEHVGRAVMRGLSIYDEETGEQLAGPEIDRLPSACCDFNGPWADLGLCVPVDSFDVPVLEVGWQVQLFDPEGNRCRGHVAGFHVAADGEGSIAEIDLDQSTWEDGPGYQDWANAIHTPELDGEGPFEGPRALPQSKVSD